MHDHDYYRGEEIQYELTHLVWEVNRVVDRRNFAWLWRHVERRLGGRAATSLDIACGSGRTMEQLQGKVDHVVGIDLSAGLMQLAHHKIGPQSYVLGDAARLPFRDGSFDLVTINGALHHIERYGETVVEAGRVLRKGGVLAILGEPSSHYMRWRNPFFSLTMLFLSIANRPRFRHVIQARREHGFENVNLEDGAHNISPHRLREALATTDVEAVAFHTYDFLPRVYSHSRLVVRLYRAMLAFEEGCLSRLLPLHGTIIRVLGVKR